MITVKSFASLKSALANTKENYIKLGANIPILENISITKFIEFGGYKFTSRGFNIQFDASFDNHRRQVFDGFSPGQIQGSFGSREIYPEWWGIIPDQSDIAINSAIQSCRPYDTGHTISLASGTYLVSSPIDLRTSRSYLVGASTGGTLIKATPQWDGNWETTQVYGSSNHSSIVWIGSIEPANQSFRTGVKGVAINAYAASQAHPDKYISCISSTGWVEENSVIEDVLLSYFSGFGVGFSNNQGVSTVNGLSLRNFWIVGSMKRNSVPIYLPAHSNVAAIRDGTIDVRVESRNTFTWPRFGIRVSGGHTVIDNLHIEGCGVGILAEAGDSPASVDIKNISLNWMMEHNMVNYNDSLPESPPPSLQQQKLEFPGTSDDWYFNYSSGVVISRTPSSWQPSKCYNITANIKNIRNYGRCKYLLRDGLYGVHYSPFGKGQYPNSGRGSLTFYGRKEGFLDVTETFPSGGDVFPYPNGSGDSNTRNKLWNGEPGYVSGPV